MAIAFGSALGSGFRASSPGTTATFNTSGAIPSGGHIIVAVAWYADGNNATMAVSGGGLTWTQDIGPYQDPGDANRRTALFSAPCPAGLASGTTITATASANSYNLSLGGFYVTGLATSSWEDAEGSAHDDTTGWLVPVTNVTANALIVGFGWVDGYAGSSAPLTNYTEVVDWVNTADSGQLSIVYRIVSSTATYSPGVTFADAPATHQWNGVALAYKAAAGGTDATVTAVVLDGTGDLVAPAVAASSEVVSPPLDATADLPAPVVSGSGNATVVAPPLVATGDAPAPAVSAGSTVTAPPLDATADLLADIPLSSEVVASPCVATADVPAPVVSSVGGTDGTVIAPPLDATGGVAAPALVASSEVVAPTLDATGDLVDPSVSGGTPPAGGGGARLLLGVGS